MDTCPIPAPRLAAMGFKAARAGARPHYSRPSVAGNVLLFPDDDGQWAVAISASLASGGMAKFLIDGEAALRAFCDNYGIDLYAPPLT